MLNQNSTESSSHLKELLLDTHTREKQKQTKKQIDTVFMQYFGQSKPSVSNPRLVDQNRNFTCWGTVLMCTYRLNTQILCVCATNVRQVTHNVTSLIPMLIKCTVSINYTFRWRHSLHVLQMKKTKAGSSLSSSWTDQLTSTPEQHRPSAR